MMASMAVSTIARQRSVSGMPTLWPSNRATRVGTSRAREDPSATRIAASHDRDTVTVRYWRTEDGPDRFRTFTWSFYAV